MDYLHKLTDLESSDIVGIQALGDKGCRHSISPKLWSQNPGLTFSAVQRALCGHEEGNWLVMPGSSL